MSIAALFEKVGVNSFHQGTKPGESTPADMRIVGTSETSGIHPIKKTPERIVDKVKAKMSNVGDGEMFDADWRNYCVLYWLERFDPSLQFLVMVRDPVDASSSLYEYHRGEKREKDPNDYLSRWIDLYSFVLEQVGEMTRPVVVLDFAGYVKGGYTKFLLDLYGKDTIGNRLEVREHLKEKLNHFVDYEVKTFKRDLVRRANKIKKRLLKMEAPKT